MKYLGDTVTSEQGSQQQRKQAIITCCNCNAEAVMFSSEQEKYLCEKCWHQSDFVAAEYLVSANIGDNYIGRIHLYDLFKKITDKTGEK